MSIYESRESETFKYSETHFGFPFSLSQLITTDCFSVAGPGGPFGVEAELSQTWALAEVQMCARGGLEPRAENRRLLWSTSLPQGALGMPVLELPRAVTKLSFLL